MGTFDTKIAAGTYGGKSFLELGIRAKKAARPR
jgi:hypothetical protein